MSKSLNIPQRPHILFITTDQQRGDCLGCEGHPVLETPYLDELAARGCRFRHAYAAVPSCTPSRAAMLTGMDQWNHGRLTMEGEDELAYPATLPGELAAGGYHTQAVGKMHFFPQRAGYGFHEMVLDESGRRFGNFYSDYHRWFDENNHSPRGYRDHSLGWNSWMSRPSHLPEHLHPTWWTATEGMRALERRDPTRPFFLWLSFARPHSPYDPPLVYFDLYKDNPNIPAPSVGNWAERFAGRNSPTDAPRTKLSDEEIRRARAAYYGNITFIDHQIGRLLYEFRRREPEAFANTLILFTSDHGDMMGDHHHWRKTCAYEGSTRVPLLMAYPETWEVERGKIHEQVVEMRDIMPTFLDAAGLDRPDSVDGESLLEIPRGNTAGWRKFIQGEHTMCYEAEFGMQYVTDGREKYVWFHHTGEEQFFDLTEDPGETRNLTSSISHQNRIGQWRERLAKINEERGDPRAVSGRLQVQKRNGALQLSPNYERWKQAALARREKLFRRENPRRNERKSKGVA
jgi:arylsulfatase